MEQFSLDKYLENQQRKVVTRIGNPARIICTDRKHGEDELPVVFLEENNGGEFLLTCRKDGRCDNYDTPYDLFFADEEEKLTEFENTMVEFAHKMFDHLLDITKEIDIKEWKGKLLDLARKEIKNNDWRQSLKSYKNAYEQGKQDALKESVETTIVNDWQYGKDKDHAIIPAIHQRIDGFNVGDKVKIIIVKTEQQ